MLALVTYDVATSTPEGRTRLRQVAKQCVNYGQRVQNSVFEINTDYSKVIALKTKLLKIIDIKQDSLRFYYLGNKWENKVEHFGAKVSYNPEGLLLV